jgi:hypothetical protein
MTGLLDALGASFAANTPKPDPTKAQPWNEARR